MRPLAYLRCSAALVLMCAGSASAETLADAIAFAYRSNPTLQSSRYDLRAADETIVQARSELRPTAELDVTGSYTRTVDGRTTSAANFFSPEASGQNSNQAQLAVEQPIYTGGRATADRRVAEANIRTQREVLRGAEGDLLLGVITAYVGVRCYQATLVSWQDNVSALERLVKEIQARQVAGELTRTDIAQAQDQLQIAREEVVATEQQLESSRTDYAALVGRNAGDLAEEPPLPQLPHDADSAYDLAERQSPELEQARYTEVASREEVAVAKSAGRPTMALRGTATLSGEAVPYRLRDQDQGFVGSVVLSMPLSEGGRVASQVRQAQDEDDSNRLKIEAERRTIDRAVSDAWNQMVASQRTLALVEAQRMAATTQLDGMINEYRVGLRSTFDVLYAEQQLTQAEVALFGAQRDRYVAQATVLRETGLLEAEAIMTGVPLYDPASHLRQVENRNALPWDKVISAIDHVAMPGTRQKMLQQPATGQQKPAIANVGSSEPDTPNFSHTLPTTPIPGTVGRPVSAEGGLH